MGSVTIIVGLRHAFVVRNSEWFFAVCLFMWGVVLLQPEELYAGANWAAFRLVLKEDTLGWLCLWGGLIRLIVLAANGAWRPMYLVRTWMAFSSAVIWFAISLGFAASGNLGTWAAMYPACFLFDAFNAFRAAFDAAEVAKAARMTPGRTNAH